MTIIRENEQACGDTVIGRTSTALAELGEETRGGQMLVAMFSECYRPIRNGVVASLDGLRVTLAEAGHRSLCVTPQMPGYHDEDPGIIRLPSWPLPTATKYRMTIPLVMKKETRRELRSATIIHAHSPFVTGWMALRWARLAGAPLVFTYHTQYDQYVHYAPIDARVAQRATIEIVRRFSNYADAVIVPTAAMARRVRELGITSRLVVAPSGIEVERFASAERSTRWRERLGARGERPLLLWVGRLAREKSVELALEAMTAPSLAEARLAIVGAGPERARLEQVAQAMRVDGRVIFLGELPREQLPALYASADVFLHTSSTETQGLVLSEALAAGLRVVAVDAPQTREVLGETLGEAAWVAEPQARELAELIGARLPGARRDGDEGRRRAARFERGLLGRRVLALYEELREGRGRPPA